MGYFVSKNGLAFAWPSLGPRLALPWPLLQNRDFVRKVERNGRFLRGKAKNGVKIAKSIFILQFKRNM